METKTSKKRIARRSERHFEDLTPAEQQAWRDASAAAQSTARARTAVRQEWHAMSMASSNSSDPEHLVTLTAEADRERLRVRDLRRLEQQWGAKMANCRRPLYKQNFANAKARAIRVLKARAAGNRAA